VQLLGDSSSGGAAAAAGGGNSSCTGKQTALDTVYTKNHAIANISANVLSLRSAASLMGNSMSCSSAAAAAVGYDWPVFALWSAALQLELRLLLNLSIHLCIVLQASTATADLPVSRSANALPSLQQRGLGIASAKVQGLSNDTAQQV
jgi:hypothetical protein